MVVEWSTNEQEGRDPVTQVLAAMDRIGFSLTVEAGRDFFGAYRLRAAGTMMMTDFVAGAAIVSRTARDIAHSALGCLFLFQQTDPRGSLFRTAMLPDTMLRAGDMVVADTDEWFHSATETGFGHRLWAIPRALVPGGAGALAGGLLLARDQSFTRILRAYLDQVAHEADHLSPEALAALTAQIGPMLEVAADPHRGDEMTRRSIATGELALLKRRIESYLFEPDFDAAAAASTGGMSLRKLHRLFEASESSFSAYVMVRRLDRARLALADPAQAHCSVAEIAFANGFNSLATFYRAFRTRYGEAPGDLRGR